MTSTIDAPADRVGARDIGVSIADHPDTDKVVTTAKLTKAYGEHLAVDDVSMTVRRGEIYGFLGPNGAGKTTTLRMLVGLIEPTSGAVSVLGRAPGDPSVVARTGVLIEGPGFYPYLSGRDNLRTMARYQGLSDCEADFALERVGLADRGGDKFRTYSLGMKQRLGVGCALLGGPDLLILDEPTNGLDPQGITEMRQLVVDLSHDGHTIVLSSHMLAEVQEMCDRVGVINHGTLLTESTVAELRGTATLFIRAMPIAVAQAAIAQALPDHEIGTAGGGLTVDVPADQAPRIAQAVIAAGAELMELRPQERSLEDVFFEMTTD